MKGFSSVCLYSANKSYSGTSGTFFGNERLKRDSLKTYANFLMDVVHIYFRAIF